MVVKFVHDDVEPFGPDDGSSIPEVPQQLLTRHGARVLNPVEAVLAPGEPRPRATAYRTASMLVPPDLVRDRKKWRAVNKVLANVDLELVEPGEEHCGPAPRPVTVRAREDAGPPVRVAAWQCLQALRAHDDTREFARDIHCEHLL